MSRFLKSNNPVLNREFKDSTTSMPQSNSFGITEESATMAGAVNKTLMLFGILMVTTVLSYQNPSALFMWTGIIGGLVAVLIATFKPKTSPYTAPAYAAFEGLFVGSISAVYAAQYAGIVFQAVSLTFATLFAMLILYKTGLIKVTQKFRSGLMMATGAIFLVYMASIIGHFVGFEVPYLHSSGPMGIGISLVIIAIASLNLLLDFDAFEKAEQHQAPKYYEWYVGLGLLVTLVWLYVEFLRLLSKLNRD